MAESTKIHVGDLRVGMFVSKLDRDWLDTPFIMQGFLIEEPDDVDIVAEYCEYVWVDEERYTTRQRGSLSEDGTATQARSNFSEYQSTLG